MCSLSYISARLAWELGNESGLINVEVEGCAGLIGKRSTGSGEVAPFSRLHTNVSQCVQNE